MSLWSLKITYDRISVRLFPLFFTENTLLTGFGFFCIDPSRLKRGPNRPRRWLLCTTYHTRYRMYLPYSSSQRQLASYFTRPCVNFLLLLFKTHPDDIFFFSTPIISLDTLFGAPSVVSTSSDAEFRHHDSFLSGNKHFHFQSHLRRNFIYSCQSNVITLKSSFGAPTIASSSLVAGWFVGGAGRHINLY